MCVRERERGRERERDIHDLSLSENRKRQQGQNTPWRDWTTLHIWKQEWYRLDLMTSAPEERELDINMALTLSYRSAGWVGLELC